MDYIYKAGGNWWVGHARVHTLPTYIHCKALKNVFSRTQGTYIANCLAAAAIARTVPYHNPVAVVRNSICMYAYWEYIE